MTQILFKGNGILSLGAVSKEEDLSQPCGISLNPPPDDGRCMVCGRHMSELTPFGGLGDPLVGDFSGEKLVKTFRQDFPYPDEVEEVMRRAKQEDIDYDSCLLTYYSEDERKKIEEIYDEWKEQCWQVSKSWECRDCIVLDDLEYFEKIGDRNEEHRNE